MSYVSEQLEKLKAKNANEPEFIPRQQKQLFFMTLTPELFRFGLRSA